jgi:hypothetical protein
MLTILIDCMTVGHKESIADERILDFLVRFDYENRLQVPCRRHSMGSQPAPRDSACWPHNAAAFDSLRK